jgi:hypothetical protein
MEVLQGSLDLGTLHVTFHAHPLKGALKSCQSILPCCNNTFSIVQFPLSDKELLLQLGGHHR